MSIQIIPTISDMQTASTDWRRDGKRIGLVPTMGCLHDGHLALIDKAREDCDVVVVSIFVNPTQFGPTEDLASYPRTWEEDKAVCEERGVDAIFAPTEEEMYLPDASTWVVEERLSEHLCGVLRPDHFRGVTTVVAKLFLAALPDVAVFGWKDAQQVLVIKRMVRDLNFPVEIVTIPIVREEDGLALSSRNRYLTRKEHDRALAVYQGLQASLEAFQDGECDSNDLIDLVYAAVEETEGDIDYAEIRDLETLKEVAFVERPSLLAVAVRYGPARLLDNVILDPDADD